MFTRNYRALHTYMMISITNYDSNLQKMYERMTSKNFISFIIFLKIIYVNVKNSELNPNLAILDNYNL